MILIDQALSNEEYETTIKTITEVVNNSFITRPMPSGVITESECTRRVEICSEIWNTLYGELHWPPSRVHDHINRFLHAILDGGKLSDYGDEMKRLPRDGSTMWAPEQLNKVEGEHRLSALARNAPIVINPKSGGKRNGN